MRYLIALITFTIIFTNFCIAQKDSSTNSISNISLKIESTNKKDSIKVDSLLSKNIKQDSTLFSLLKQHPLIKDGSQQQVILSNFKIVESKEIIFYVIAFCFFTLAITKSLFPKYFNSIFSIFFQTNFRQKQTKEQLLQDNIAAICTNVVFFLSFAVFASLQVPIYYKNSAIPLWQILSVALITICCIYTFKYIFIYFLGWVFNIKEASNAYLFIVFIINKVIGIVLLPFCLILAFCNTELINILEVIVFIIIGLLMVYRLFLTYRSTNTRLKINLLHFFIYFCSLEILPLLIVFKVLQNFL